MAKINMLQWRDERRQQKQRDFVSSIGAVALMTCFLFSLSYLYIEGMQKHQERRHRLLQDEILVVDKKIIEIKNIEEKKNQLLTKIEIIHELQESRPQIVHLFDELAKITPEGIFLSKFIQTGKSLVFTGNTQSNARVSAYMRGIENSNWLESPVLQEIKGETKNGQKNNFSLAAKQGKEIKVSEDKK